MSKLTFDDGIVLTLSSLCLFILSFMFELFGIKPMLVEYGIIKGFEFTLMVGWWFLYLLLMEYVYKRAKR